MGRGFNAAGKTLVSEQSEQSEQVDRTGRLTIHPELLDGEGRLTEEDLLTVRFGGDSEPPNPTSKPGE